MRNILHQLGKIQDIRQNQGKRYQLKSILGLVIIGYMAGCTSLAKIHKFGIRLNKTNRLKLGFKRSMPSHPTITETLKKVNPEELEQTLGKIVANNGSKFTHIAIDGKSIRSTSVSKEGLLHVVSAYAPEINGVLLQAKSGLAGGEIKAAERMLSSLDIKGKIITADALFAQEVICGKIVEFNGDYVFKVKKNKKRIIQDIEEAFADNYQTNLPIISYESIDKAHGRIDHRRIEVVEAKRKYFGGWGVDTIKQAARITRKVYNVKKESERVEIHYIISSLPASGASPKDLLHYSVNHWSIENNLHRTRDTHFKEDICNIICHKSQQINAAIRNLAIFLLSKITNSIMAAIEQIQQQITNAFKLFLRRI